MVNVASDRARSLLLVKFTVTLPPSRRVAAAGEMTAAKVSMASAITSTAESLVRGARPGLPALPGSPATERAYSVSIPSR